jgi:hypothetical protein
MDTKKLVKSIKTLDDGIINNIFSFMKMKSPWICSNCEFNLEEHLHMKCAGCFNTICKKCVAYDKLCAPHADELICYECLIDNYDKFIHQVCLIGLFKRGIYQEIVDLSQSLYRKNKLMYHGQGFKRVMQIKENLQIIKDVYSGKVNQNDLPIYDAFSLDHGDGSVTIFYNSDDDDDEEEDDDDDDDDDDED